MRAATPAGFSASANLRAPGMLGVGPPADAGELATREDAVAHARAYARARSTSHENDTEHDAG